MVSADPLLAARELGSGLNAGTDWHPGSPQALFIQTV